MPDLYQKVEQDYLNAAKGGDKATASVLSLLKSELKNASIAKGGPITEEDFVKVVTKEIKKRKEAISAYEKGGRPELAEAEKTELGVLSRYAPQQVSPDEIRQRVRDTLSELESPDFGIVMAKVMGQFQGRADGGEVSKIVKEEVERGK